MFSSEEVYLLLHLAEYIRAEGQISYVQVSFCPEICTAVSRPLLPVFQITGCFPGAENTFSFGLHWLKTCFSCPGYGMIR